MSYKRVVIKLGTSVLTKGSPQLNQAVMVEIARQVALLQKEGVEIVICSSGAIASGRERLGYPELPAKIRYKQMLAAVGQSRLMLLWERFFQIYGIDVGQILLTRADVDDRRRFLNARDSLRTLLDYQIIPIINENDAVATAEIKVGDNDNLSALAVLLTEADLLIMLTDQEGLFTADPRTDPEAALIGEVAQIDDALRQIAGGAVSGLGTGGMATKLQAADIARRAGADVIIASGSLPNVIERLVRGERLGTRFVAVDTPIRSRKQWILAGSSLSGSLVIDKGAVRAMTVSNRSLLPAGILSLNGNFQRGDTVGVKDEAGQEIGRGIVRYDHVALSQIQGVQSEEIEQILGYADSAVVIHRDDFVLSQG